MPEARVNGIRIYYEERGEGAPILCVHGAGSSALMWGDAIEELSQIGRVISYDRRGCTRSERPQPYDRTTVAEHAEDAAALLDALAATPAVAIGRSYGGAVAIDLALRHPDRVRALVLLEGDALGLSPRGAEWTKAIGDRLGEVAAEFGVDAVGEAMINEALGEGAWDSFPDEVRQMFTRNGRAILAELRFESVGAPERAAFAAIEAPVLLVTASASPPEQREMSAAMADALPNARAVKIGGGHLIDPAGPQVLDFIQAVVESR